MKKFLIAVLIVSIAACSSGTGANSTDSTTAPGNSDGSNTIGADTAHIDTSLGKIKSDSVR